MNTNRAVSCPEAVAAGKVCTHAVTVKQLLDWGIDCEIILDHMRWPGQPRNIAVHQSWVAGHTQVCTLAPPQGGHTATFQTSESAADAFAWVQTNCREQAAA